MNATTLADRFFAKVDKTDTCWIWTAARINGYGRFGVNRKMTGAHRWSYEYHVGPIPEGLTIDHLCRNRACVNPDHLEAVSLAENIARVPLRSHCPKGHEFNEANTYLFERPNGTRPTQHCRACAAERARKRYAARLAS